MEAQRKFQENSQKYFAEAAAIEAKLLSITSDVINERDSLRKKVEYLQKQVDAAELLLSYC